MNTIQIIDFWIFMAAMGIAGNISKKEPGRFRKLMADTLGYVMGIGLPLCFIQLLAVFGFELFEIPWSITPLDFMAAVSYLFFFALCVEKWAPHCRKPEEKKSSPQG